MPCVSDGTPCEPTRTTARPTTAQPEQMQLHSRQQAEGATLSANRCHHGTADPNEKKPTRQNRFTETNLRRRDSVSGPGAVAEDEPSEMRPATQACAQAKAQVIDLLLVGGVVRTPDALHLGDLLEDLVDLAPDEILELVPAVAAVAQSAFRERPRRAGGRRRAAGCGRRAAVGGAGGRGKAGDGWGWPGRKAMRGGQSGWTTGDWRGLPASGGQDGLAAGAGRGRCWWRAASGGHSAGSGRGRRAAGGGRADALHSESFHGWGGGVCGCRARPRVLTTSALHRRPASAHWPTKTRQAMPTCDENA